MDQHFSQESDILSDDAFTDVVHDLGPATLNFIYKEEPFGVPDEPSQVFEPFLSLQHHDFQPTMVATQQEPMPSVFPPRTPPSTSKLPCTDHYLGPHNFSLWLDTEHFSNNSMYSRNLNKIFITRGTKLPLKFKWNQVASTVYLRALPCFERKDYFEEPVRRCISHEHPTDNSNNGFKHVSHVVRCENKDTYYDEDSDSGRLSLLVPLDAPQPGTDWVTVTMSFVCKNSCMTGMNRRAIVVIFTLETEWGEVLGRETLGVRICSCPKRDMKKEEGDFKTKVINKDEADLKGTPGEETVLLIKFGGKRLMDASNSDPLSNKKHKISLSDDSGFKVFTGLEHRCAKFVMSAIVGEAAVNQRDLTPLEKKQVKECERFINPRKERPES